MVAKLIKLSKPWDQSYRTTLRIEGLDAKKHYDLDLNNSVVKGIPAQELLAYPIIVLPTGEVIPKRK